MSVWNPTHAQFTGKCTHISICGLVCLGYSWPSFAHVHSVVFVPCVIVNLKLWSCLAFWLSDSTGKHKRK